MLRIAFTANISEKDGTADFGKITTCYKKYFSENNLDPYLFHWASLKKNGSVEAYHNDRLEKELFLKDEVDIIFTSELGKIYNRKEEFLDYLNFLENIEDIIKVNSPKKMRGNLDKHYLFNLQKNNFSIIPTISFSPNLQTNDFKDFQKTNRAKDLIIKPRFFGEVGEGVRKLSSFKENELKEYIDNLDQNIPSYFKSKEKSLAIVQPFMEEINKGEISLFYLGKNMSHAFEKVAKQGEIINMANGWLCKRYIPNKEQLSIGSEIIEYYEDEKQITRIDFILCKGKWLISEVERINPAPFLEELNLGKDFSIKLCEFFKKTFF